MRHRSDPPLRTLHLLIRIALAVCLAVSMIGGGTATEAAPTAVDRPADDTTIEACPQGPFQLDHTLQRTSLNSVVMVGAEAWAVGMRSATEDDRSIVAAHWDGVAWQEIPVADRGGEQALFAIDRSPRGTLVAAGYRTVNGLYQPYVMRWAGTRWRPQDLGKVGGRAGVLTGISARSEDDIWAVGYHSRTGGQRPSVLHGSLSTGWRAMDPVIPAGSTGALMDVDARVGGAVWAVGWITIGGTIRPYSARRVQGRWKPAAIPTSAAHEGVLTSVAISPSGAVWAVGYRVAEGRYLPLVLRWQHGRWVPQADVDVDTDVAVLRAVEIDPAGRPVAVGTRWDAARSLWRGFILARANDSWQVVEAPVAEGASDLRDAAINRSGTTWAVGSAARRSLAFEVCPRSTTAEPPDGPPPPVGTSAPALPDVDLGFGADDPYGPDTSAPPTQTPAGSPAPAGTSVAPSSEGPAPATSLPGATDQPAPVRTPIPSPQTIEPRPGGISVVARDVAKTTGLSMRTTTYGAVATDYDADGWPDLFIGRHANPGWLARNTGGAFEPAPGVSIARRDRHGCSAGDANGDGRIDFYCAVGAVHGANLKANELLIQQPDGSFLDQAIEMRAADPVGRGRMAAFFDLDHDGHDDLFVADRPDRTDGLPSRHRVLINPTGDRYRPASTAGFDAGLGADCVRAADLDGDGWEDIVLCARANDRPDGFGVRILRNVKGRLVDVTRASGIEPIDALDAIVADMDGDGRPDIVEVAPWELRVLLRRGDRYVVGYRRVISGGVAVAAGDVDADGDLDLYVVLGVRTKQRDDLLLINRGNGRSYGTMTIPQTRTGSAESVTAIDHDRNGLMDFLVLNGRGALHVGPVQLIAFFPATRPTEPVEPVEP